MIWLWRLAAGMAALLAAFIVFPSNAAALETVEYLVHISVDGLRGDKLRDLVAASPGTYPNFRRLELQGAYTYNARSDWGYTETVPNHVSIITGRPVDAVAGQPNTTHHGINFNFPGGSQTIQNSGNANVSYKASTFDIAHDNGRSTGLYTSKVRLGFLDRSYSATTGAVDTTLPDNGRDKIDFAQLVDNTSAAITTALATQLSSATPRNYTFLHLTETDGVGHSQGWDGQPWADAARDIDSRLGQLFTAIDGNSILSGNTAIVLTADHGGGVQVHVDPTAWQNFNIPFFVWGGGLTAGSDLYTLMENRVDPGRQGRPDYADANQPIHNGDSANVAMQLLGLPEVPGSFMHPVFSTPPVGMQGDVNGDEMVNEADAMLLLSAFVPSPPSDELETDFNDDGVTDLKDLLILQQHWSGPPPPGAPATAVPEPGAAVLAWGAVCLCVLTRRRRRR